MLLGLKKLAQREGLYMFVLNVDFSSGMKINTYCIAVKPIITPKLLGVVNDSKT